jgi:uncharacterized membrane protein HdeD (DUF308 family)/acetyl esterase/lipase
VTVDPTRSADDGSTAGRFRWITSLVARAPRWLALLLGVACVALGAALLVRPLGSLTVLIVLVGVSLIVSGVTDVLAERSVDVARTRGLAAAVSVILGVTVLMWPGLSLEALALVVGAALIVTGLVRAAGVLRGTWDARLAALLLGVASVVFGVLAIAWPDVTQLVVAVLFGARMLWFGLETVWGAVSRRDDDSTQDAERAPGLLRRSSRVLAAVVALVVAVALSGLSGQLREGEPVVDDFYAAPSDVPDEPGQLLRSEPFARAVPDGAQAWRILYTTTRDDGIPALASGIVLVSTDAPDGPRPMVAWAHGTTGYEPSCAPSLASDPFGSGALPALDDIVDNGWVLVATDYVGLGTAAPHPYLIGQGEGRSVLDAVRATQQLDTVDVENEVVVWGHSQGGHAALWTGQLAPVYAPDVNVVGVSAMAPASDLEGLVRGLPTVTGGSIFASYVVAAYDQIYPDANVEDYLRPAARTFVRSAAQRCLAEPSVFVSILTALSLSEDPDIFRTDPTTGAFGERLAENVPTGSVEAPLLVAQGLADPLVLPAVQAEYVAARCAAGQELEYRTYEGFDHVGVVSPGSPLVPELVAWTQKRFAGEPTTSDCASLD